LTGRARLYSRADKRASDRVFTRREVLLNCAQHLFIGLQALASAKMSECLRNNDLRADGPMRDHTFAGMMARLQLIARLVDQLSASMV
jgi:hypothetical protein